jgi:hypothetical protein
MRLIRSALLAAVIGLLGLGAGHAQTDGGDLERVVARNVQDMLPDDGHGGVAVALRSGGRILFYNYGKANAGSIGRSRQAPSSISHLLGNCLPPRCWPRPSNAARCGSTIRSQTM